MSSLNERIKKLEFHQQLLLEMIQSNRYPFYQMIIEKGLSKEEMEAVLSLCEEVNRKYMEEKEEGLIDYTPLLTHFVGMLHPKLCPKETIAALDEQGFYRPLMKKLKKLMDEME